MIRRYTIFYCNLLYSKHLQNYLSDRKDYSYSGDFEDLLKENLNLGGSNPPVETMQVKDFGGGKSRIAIFKVCAHCT